MTIEAVVALKTLSQSKRRLSAVLNDSQRCDLVEAMARDVLSCLMAHPEIDTVHAVCGDGWPTIATDGVHGINLGMRHETGEHISRHRLDQITTLAVVQHCRQPPLAL